jgi:hypothetical protein
MLPMTNPSEIVELLDELERHSGTQDKASKEARRAVWEALAPHFGKSSALGLVDELAVEVGAQPITVRRWVSGEYAPQPTFLKRIRQHFGTGTPVPSPVKGNPAPEAPVPFGGAYAAFKTIGAFFYSVQFAKSCFVFKGMLGFHAARSQTTRVQVVDALRSNGALNAYYVFPKDSEAEVTFDKLKRGIVLIDPECAERIHDVRVAKDKDSMGLGLSLASPFVVVYSEAGREKFRRQVDIWYELPVERVTADNEVNDCDPLFVFVQLPAFHSEEVWQQWRDCLKTLVQPDGTPEIKAEDLG